MNLRISPNEITDEFKIRAEETLKEHLVESQTPPPIDVLARYLAEDLGKMLVEMSDPDWLIEHEDRPDGPGEGGWEQ